MDILSGGVEGAKASVAMNQPLATNEDSEDNVQPPYGDDQNSDEECPRYMLAGRFRDYSCYCFAE